MRLSIDQVKKVATLANLTLASEEEKKFSKQLSKILDYVEELNQVDTLGVEPMFNVVNKENVVREDVSEVGLSQEEALQNAPQKKDGFFVTSGIFKD